VILHYFACILSATFLLTKVLYVNNGAENVNFARWQ